MNNIYEKYKVKKVINASGKMTILGGSRVEDEIAEAMKLGASNFFEVKNLNDKVGEYISELLGVESAMVVLSASAGIAMTVGATVSNGLREILNLNNLNKKDREIVLMKGHNVDYGTTVQTAIQMGGGIVQEAGYANLCTIEHLEESINENTKGLLYVKSHHCVQKGMLSPEEFIKIGEKYKLPVIIDAAAEEDLIKYFKLGADAVIYSGTKALEGPTSGLIIGKKDFLEKVKLQNKGIGRILKVGKESIIGLAKAIELYVEKNQETIEEQENRVRWFLEEINKFQGVKCKFSRDLAGRNITRVEMEVCSNEKSAREISDELRNGEIAIYTRDYNANLGKIEIDIRALTNDELEIILKRIEKILK